MTTFEGLVKKNVDAGLDIATAIGRAIDEDPEAYADYLKRQKGGTTPKEVKDRGGHGTL